MRKAKNLPILLHCRFSVKTLSLGNSSLLSFTILLNCRFVFTGVDTDDYFGTIRKQSAAEEKAKKDRRKLSIGTLSKFNLSSSFSAGDGCGEDKGKATDRQKSTDSGEKV